MKIKDIVSLKNFKSVVNIKWAENSNIREELLNNYIITEDLADLLGEVLETINMVRHESKREKSGALNNDAKRSHIISGQYGTGKSYFLLMLSMILELKDKGIIESLSQKLENFQELNYQLNQLINGKKQLVVRINGHNENEKRFNNVIQEAVINKLELEFDDVKLKSNYQNIIDNLEDHKSDDKRWEILKSSFKNKNYEYNDLVAGLKGRQIEAKNRYYDLMNEAGLSSGKKFKNITEFLEDVDEYLSDKNYDNLIIIFDEFSIYIESSIEDKRINTDLSSIQDLAQFTDPTSGYDIAFIASTHVDMNDLLQKTLSNKEAIEKVMRRFEQHLIAFEQGNELIKNTIEVDKDKIYSLRQKFLSDFTLLEDKFQVDLSYYYPLHPATLKYLKPISDNFAQAESTLFTFLKEVVKEKYLNQRVENNGLLNLVQIDDVFDYFYDSLKTKDPSLIKAYNQLMGISNSELKEKLIKALVVSRASLISLEGAGLSVEELNDIFFVKNKEMISKALEEMADGKTSPLVLSEDKYELIPGGQTIDLEKKLKKKAQNINPYQQLLNILNEFNEQIDIKTDYHISYKRGVFPIDREIKGKFLSVTELRNYNIDKHFKNNKEGEIIFIIPDFNENYNKENLVNQFMNKMKEMPLNTSLAFPENIFFDEQDLKMYGALNELEADNDIMNNENLKKLFIQRKRKLEGKIKNVQLRKFGSINNFNIIIGGNKNIKRYNNDIEFFKDLFYNYYTKFPYEIDTENVNDRSSSNKLIDRLIISGEDIISKDSSSVFQKHVFNTMEPLDLISKDEQPNNFNVKIKSPERKNSEISFEIWETICDTNLDIKEKFNKLKAAPYGLNDPLVEIYVALAIGLGKFRLREVDGKVITKPGKDHISEIYSSNYILEKIPDTSTEKKEKVKGIWEVFSVFIPNSKYKDYDPRGTWRDTEVLVVLGKEIKSIKQTLKNNKISFENLGLKTVLLSELIKEFDNIIISKSPEELYNKLIELVNKLFETESFDKNLKALEDLVLKIKKITETEEEKIKFINKKYYNLKNSIEDLNDYDDLKCKLNKIKNKIEVFRDDPFDFEKMNEINDKVNKLVLNYNEAFKESHDKYYSKYENIKKEILKNEMLDIVEALEKIQFNEIKSIDSRIMNLKNYKKCTQLEITKNEVSKCNCKIKNLRIAESELLNLEEILEEYKKEINNIYSRYYDELNIKAQEIDNYIQVNKSSKIEDWKIFIKAMNEDPIKHKNIIINKVNELFFIINEFLKEESIPNNLEYTNTKHFIDMFEKNIKTYGLKEISFEKLKSIFENTCRNLETDFDGLKNRE